MLDTNLVLRQMEGAGTRLNIVILDACRNNPFGGRSLAVGRAQDAQNVRLRDTAGGLAQMQAPEGTLISFATQPGSVAQDGAGGNSPYSKALADTIRKPGLGIFDAFNQVGLQVKRATKGAQQPWVSSSPIDGAFYFVPPDGAGPQVADLRLPTPAITAPAPTTSDVRRFDGVWAVEVACKKSGALPDFKRRFLATISNGVFRVQQGLPGSPGGITLEGTIDADGAMRAFAEGNVTQPPSDKFSYTMMGRLEGTSGTGTRDDRDCDVKFTKQLFPIAPAASARHLQVR